MKKVFALILALAMIFTLCGCECRHQWSEATCTEPSTCAKCGATDGEALGHDFIPATCTTPKTCSRCGATDGEAIGHIWQDATDITPITCVICGATDGGSPIDGTWKHKLAVGYWEYVIDTVKGEYTVLQIGANYSDILGTYSIEQYSETELTDGFNIFKYVNNTTLIVTPIDSPTKSKTYTKDSDSTTPISYDYTDTNPAPVNPSRHTDEQAYKFACEIISSALKAPSTTTFCDASDCSVYHLGNGEYCVTGWVDAENSFGAMLRSNFIVTYTAVEDGYKNGSAIVD